MTAEEHKLLKERFARIRRLKFMLKFVPRRAVFHKYPLVGRFASFARKRSYLWSFRSPEVRPAIYIGCLLSYMPAVGVQMPAAFILSLVFRVNFMVLGGLQFITNFLTAGPIYWLTYRIGLKIMEISGFGEHLDHSQLPPSPPPETLPDLHAVQPPPPSGTPTHWLSHVLKDVNAMVIGGVVLALITAVVLDALWLFSARSAARHHEKVLRRKHAHNGPSEISSDAPPPSA